LPSISSSSMAATYQQFFRNMTISPWLMRHVFRLPKHRFG
jgi:hypothetical protein